MEKVLFSEDLSHMVWEEAFLTFVGDLMLLLKASSTPTSTLIEFQANLMGMCIPLPADSTLIYKERFMESALKYIS